MALTVLDRHGHLITCLPWTQKAMESEESWVKPLPDGMGVGFIG